MTKMYEKRVAKGAALLDEKKPDWWNGKRKPTIDLSRLDLGNTCNCVLGQVFRTGRHDARDVSSYVIGKEELGLVDGDSHGFDVSVGNYTRRRKSYKVLGQRWLELIRRRRRAAARKARSR